MNDRLGIRFLVVDDEESIRRLCTTIAAGLGFTCMEAPNGEAALALLEEQPADIILTDLIMPRMSGLEFLERVKRLLPRSEIAVMTGHGSVETAVQAMKLGAYDYISKPFSPIEELRLFLRRMADKIELVEENQFLRERVETEAGLHGIVGSTPKIQDVLRMVSRLKDTRTPALIVGESGTGKELVARAIHFRGTFANRPFVAVDCGSLVPTLIESELFGYERGAFTGAVRSKQGLFQSANGGTIFLDEIGDIDPSTQVKLLRVMGEQRSFERVGGTQTLRADVRVIAATNKNLEQLVREGKFRDDLYFRLNVVRITMPPLRSRKEDIPLLVRSFLRYFSKANEKPLLDITTDALNTLLAYDWPGNVRELRTAIEHGVVMASGPKVTVRDLPRAIRDSVGNAAGTITVAEKVNPLDLAETEKRLITQALASTGGNITAAADQLGISRRTLHRKLNEMNAQGRNVREAARAAKKRGK